MVFATGVDLQALALKQQSLQVSCSRALALPSTGAQRMGLQDQTEVSLQPWLFFLGLDSELGISNQIHPKGARLAELGGLTSQCCPLGPALGRRNPRFHPTPSSTGIWATPAIF